MEPEAKAIKEALRRILDVERQHLFGAKAGSQSARRNELDKVLNKVLTELTGKKKP